MDVVVELDFGILEAKPLGKLVEIVAAVELLRDIGMMGRCTNVGDEPAFEGCPDGNSCEPVVTLTVFKG